MADHMRAELCCETLNHANLRFPEIRGAIVHSDRGSQYTSAAYRAVIQKCDIVQSMNSAGGRCHDNARCESIWARMKEELFYHQGRKTEHYKMEELKFMVWRYFMSYWSNRRRRDSSCCKAAKILRSGCRRTLRFIILVGNVSSVIDNFRLSASSRTLSLNFSHESSLFIYTCFFFSSAFFIIVSPFHCCCNMYIVSF